MLFCGIDLHSNNCFVVISDDDDRVLYSRRLPNNLDQICAALNPYRTNLFGVVGKLENIIEGRPGLRFFSQECC